MTESVPGADRGPRAASPRGVVEATRYQPLDGRDRLNCNPAAIVPGTDLITIDTLPSYDKS